MDIQDMSEAERLYAETPFPVAEASRIAEWLNRCSPDAQRMFFDELVARFSGEIW